MKITEERLEELRNLPQVKRVKELRKLVDIGKTSDSELEEWYQLTRRSRELDPNVFID
jgi:hypothetical protein